MKSQVQDNRTFRAVLAVNDDDNNDGELRKNSNQKKEFYLIEMDVFGSKSTNNVQFNFWIEQTKKW